MVTVDRGVRGGTTAFVVAVVSLVVSLLPSSPAVGGAVPDGSGSAQILAHPVVSAEGAISCGLRVDGSAACWGYGGAASMAAPAGPFTQIEAAPESGACALALDQTVHCWGASPGDPAGTYTAISVGGAGRCGLRTDQTVSCGGSPKVPGSYTQLSVGFAHGCALRTDNIVVCWGDNGFGKARPPATPFKAVTAGLSSSCGILMDDTLDCWGEGYRGISTPPLGTFIAVSAGYGHNCGIRTAGTLICWGENSQGSNDVPEGTYKDLTAGGNQNCAIRTDDVIVCWGANDHGQARPTVTGAAPAAATVGVPYSHTFTATESTPLAFVVVAGTLPPGLTLDEQSGQLTGTPLATGSFGPITVAATNDLVSGTQTFTIEVRSAPHGFQAVAPTRVLDSRSPSQVGPHSTPWKANAQRDVTFAGVGPIAAHAKAVVLNVTVTTTTADSFLTIWPTGSPRPLVSNLNWTAGLTIANAVTVPVGANGKVSIYNSSGQADVIADVAGYYTQDDGLGFSAFAPVRIQDSRPSSTVGPYATPWSGGSTRNVVVTGGPVPAGAQAVMLNVTVTGTSAPSYLSIGPSGQALPVVSSLNWKAGATIANAVTVRVGVGGAISVFNAAGDADVIIDITGFFASDGGHFLHLTEPTRVQDSRPESTVGSYTTPWQAATTRGVTAAVAAPVPPYASSVVTNVTVTSTTAASHLTMWPSGQPKPVASTLNWVAGQTIPNAATVRLGAQGTISVFNSAGSADVIIDLFGYFAPPPPVP